MRHKCPDILYVRQCLREEDGRLFWLPRPEEHFADKPMRNQTQSSRVYWNSRYANTEAGKHTKGRCRITLDKVTYKRSHIVWLFHKGWWPDMLDHHDRDYTNDRIDNLRPATVSQNACNREKSPSNISGFKGVSWHRRDQKWRASIKINGKFKHLGLFDDPAQAHEIYRQAATELHGDFARV